MFKESEKVRQINMDDPYHSFPNYVREALNNRILLRRDPAAGGALGLWLILLSLRISRKRWNSMPRTSG
jgi:hypothetical protein